MQSVIRIGSRESLLAVRQAEIIGRLIQKYEPGIRTEIVTMKTTGDRILDRSLASIGGKGLFVKELDRSLREGKIDLAVHSLKDMPMEEDPDLPILAYGTREDARDVLMFAPGLSGLPEHAVIGTSSRRREIQMRYLYPGCIFRGIRGNVQTRMRKLEQEDYDATLLAAAGLNRLGMQKEIGRYFSVDEMIPAAGQGILAVQGRKEDHYPFLERINDPDSMDAARAERAFVRRLGGDCTSPCAAHAQVTDQELRLTGLYYDEEAELAYRASVCTGRESAVSAAEKLAERLLEKKVEPWR